MGEEGGENLYAFVRNNPLSFRDHWGYQPWRPSERYFEAINKTQQFEQFVEEFYPHGITLQESLDLWEKLYGEKLSTPYLIPINTGWGGTLEQIQKCPYTTTPIIGFPRAPYLNPITKTILKYRPSGFYGFASLETPRFEAGPLEFGGELIIIAGLGAPNELEEPLIKPFLGFIPGGTVAIKSVTGFGGVELETGESKKMIGIVDIDLPGKRFGIGGFLVPHEEVGIFGYFKFFEFKTPFLKRGTWELFVGGGTYWEFEQFETCD
jgi:hypothetical protein